MASKLIVNEIEHTDGSGTAVTMAKATIADATITTGSIASGTLGSAVVYPAGHIVQTKLNSRSSKVTFGSTGFETAGIPVTITPAYSNSKMLIQLYGKTDMNNSTTLAGQDYKITRATGSAESESSGMVFKTELTNKSVDWGPYWGDCYPPLVLTWIDSSYPDEQITYGMFGRKYSGSGAAWSFADDNGGSYWGCMIVQEIKQ